MRQCEHTRLGVMCNASSSSKRNIAQMSSVGSLLGGEYRLSRRAIRGERYRTPEPCVRARIRSCECATLKLPNLQT